MAKNEFIMRFWRPVPGYDRYIADAISGEVWTTNWRGTGLIKRLNPFKMHKHRDNYLGLNLWKDGKQGPVVPVHRIIALTFPEICGEYFDGAVINHKDERHDNNVAFNLEWVTNRYNVTYGTTRERQFKTKTEKGLYCGFHQGTEEYKEYWRKRWRENWHRKHPNATYKI